MTTAVAYQPPLLPAGASLSVASTNPPLQLSRDVSSSRPKSTNSGKEVKVIRGRRERPCDACRKRKSKCVTTEGPKKVCAACSLHGQECTYIEDPQPRKRRQDQDGKDQDSTKRRLVNLFGP